MNTYVLLVSTVFDMNEEMLSELILAKVAPNELHEEQADDHEKLPTVAEKHLSDHDSCSNPTGQDCKIAEKYHKYYINIRYMLK